jgi:hypothetical protein
LNKFLPYILGLLLLVAVIILFATGSNKKIRKLDERVTLRRQDKIPYGTFVAYRNLKHIFPNASIYSNKFEPGFWDSLSIQDSKQVFIAVCVQFNPDEDEMKKLITFIENGNDVFISAIKISYDAEKIINCSTNDYMMPSYFGEELVGVRDTMNVTLNKPPFVKISKYSYPGKPYGSVFTKINEKTTNVLGDGEDLTNFIHLKAGKGNFYIHLSPMAFSNYFILHKNNFDYYEKALSVINPDVTKVMWDEYYLNKKSSDNNPAKKKSWIAVLFRYPSLKAALLTAIFALLLYVLLEMRRKQRIIPVQSKPRNDSLDFVKTIGRLYYDKGDHKNLCRKMGAYFLEHVRNKYKLPTGSLEDEFVKNLQYKSGAEESEIRGIISFIKYLDEAESIDNKQLINFHKDLESFYKKA